MNTRYDLRNLGDKIVYVKTVLIDDLPQEVRDHAGELTQLFAVHNAKGEQLALVANRSLAFQLARQHDMSPVAVH